MKISFETHNNEAGWIAWIDAMPGMVEQGDTKQEAFDELMISLKVKLAYDNQLSPC